MDYGKIGKRLEARVNPGPAAAPDGDEVPGDKADDLEESFTPKQAEAIRAYVKACMNG